MYKQALAGSFFRLDEDSNGDYFKDNKRWSLLEAPNFIDCPSQEELDRFAELSSLDEAISYYGVIYSPKQI